MKNSSSFLMFILLIGLAVITGCKQNTNSPESSHSIQQENNESASNKGQAYIVDESGEPNALRVALDSPDHTTLVAAIEAAEVQNALVNVGPLTVFAPTNTAFDKLPKETLEDLLKPENKAKLSYILQNHVAPSNNPMDMLIKNEKKGRSLYMASGENVPVTREGDDILVGGTKIIGSVKVSNGWVHVIDDIILPQQ